MLYPVAAILVVLWAFGLVTGTSIGGLGHILLVYAVIMVLLQSISRHRTG